MGINQNRKILTTFIVGPLHQTKPKLCKSFYDEDKTKLTHHYVFRNLYDLTLIGLQLDVERCRLFPHLSTLHTLLSCNPF